MATLAQSAPADDGSTVNRVLVADQIAWDVIPREGFSDLLRDPFRCWASRDIDQGKLAPSQADNHQNIELNEADGWNHEQIHRGDVWRMVAQEGAPVLTGRIISLTIYLATID